MSVRFVAVNWNRQKRLYDGILALGVALTVAVYAAVTLGTHPAATAETALIRALGFTALLLLHLILAIGPLARIDRRFLPLLYNRRHLGVTMAVLALGHAGFVVFQYHALGNVNPFVSVLTSNGLLSFELFGAVALLILLLMAATSHDFWLATLTPPVWKRLHMLVYAAYAAVAAHVGWGALQDPGNVGGAVWFGAGALAIGALHVAAATRTRSGDRPPPAAADGWVDLGPATAIPEGRAVVGVVAGERVAVFRHEGRLSCVSNVCAHQNGPLGEGRIVDGCITCPWHGYQYRPADGRSPPPFDDVIPTFNLRVDAGRVLVDPRPNPPGTPVEPVPAPAAAQPPAPAFYIGYLPEAPPDLAAFDRRVVAMLLALAVASAAALAATRGGFEPVAFDYGRNTTVTGVVRARPWPVLEVPRPGADAGVSRYLLAGFGKHGAQAAVRGLDGRTVTVTGPLAYRSHLTLLEIAEIGTPAGGGEPMEPEVNLGSFDLVGEIVDGKCYIGVMSPGRGTTHRGCAVRCLAGGLPPLFVVENDAGSRLEMLLVTPDGAALDGLGRWVGRRVATAGRVSRLGDLWLLRADPASLRELP